MAPDITTDEIARRRRRKELPKARPRGVLPFLPTDRELLPAWLTAAFRPPKGYEFEAFARTSVRKPDPCSITFRNGRERRTFRFDAQRELAAPSLRNAVLGISNGWLQMTHLTGSEIEDVWAGLCTVAHVMTEYDSRDETVKWVQQLIDESAALRGRTLVEDGRHDALMAMRAQGEFVRRDAEQLVKGGDGWQRRPTRFVDGTSNRQYMRAGETATFVRYVVGERVVAHSNLRARLAEIEIEWQRHEDRRPPHPKLNLYLLSDEMVEYAESTDPTAPKPVREAQQRLIENERATRFPA